MVRQLVSDPFVALFAVGCVLLVGTIVITLPQRSNVMMFAVGGSAALFGFQVMQVHVFTVLVAAWWLMKFVDRDHKFDQGFRIWLFVAASLFVASTVIVGDLVVNPKTAVQWVFLTAGAALVAMASTHRERITAMYGMLTVIVLSCLYGVGQLAKVLPTRSDTEHLFISAIGRPTGLWPEPDWLGMYAAIGVVLALSLRMSTWLRIPTVTLCLAMWVLAFARGAWIALAVTAAIAVLLVVIHPSRRPSIKPQAQALGFAAAVTALVVVVVPELSGNVQRRLEQTFGVAPGDVSGQARLQQLAALRTLEDSSPWYGHGLSAAGRVDVSGGLFLDPGWKGNSVASNWVVGLWVDARWLAVPFLVVVFCLVAVALWRREVAAFVALVVMAASFFSNATFQPVFWFALGCCLAALVSTARAGESHRAEQVLEPDRDGLAVEGDVSASA